MDDESNKFTQGRTFRPSPVFGQCCLHFAADVQNLSVQLKQGNILYLWRARRTSNSA